MRIKNLVLSLALGLTVAAVGAGTIAMHESGAPLIAEAAQPEGWSYVISGSMNGWSAAVGEDGKLHTSDPSYEFHYVENGDPVEGQTEYWEVTFFAQANAMFKIVANGPNYTHGKWEMKYDECGIDGKSEYFTSESGGAVVVTASGNYTIRLASNFAESDDKSSGIWVTSDVELVDVIYHYDEGVTVTDKESVGVSFIPSFKFVDGYYIEGFYTDAAYEHAWPTEGVVATAGEAINVYVKTTICAPEDDYYAYVEAWADNPFEYAYIFSTTTGADTVWPGIKGEIAPISYVTGEGIALYRVLVPAEYEADMIIFHNNKGEQTGDMPLNGPAVYPSGNKETATGPMEDSADKIAALAFLKHYKTLRNDHEWEGEPLKDSICWIIADNAAWTELKGLYEAITDKALVDGVADVDGTIGETMDYLYSRMEGTPEGNLPIVFNNDDDTAMIVSLSIVGGLFVIVALGAVLFAKRKRAR